MRYPRNYRDRQGLGWREKVRLLHSLGIAIVDRPHARPPRDSAPAPPAMESRPRMRIRLARTCFYLALLFVVALSLAESFALWKGGMIWFDHIRTHWEPPRAPFDGTWTSYVCFAVFALVMLYFTLLVSVRMGLDDFYCLSGAIEQRVLFFSGFSGSYDRKGPISSFFDRLGVIALETWVKVVQYTVAHIVVAVLAVVAVSISAAAVWGVGEIAWKAFATAIPDPFGGSAIVDTLVLIGAIPAGILFVLVVIVVYLMIACFIEALAGVSSSSSS